MVRKWSRGGGTHRGSGGHHKALRCLPGEEPGGTGRCTVGREETLILSIGQNGLIQTGRVIVGVSDRYNRIDK